MATKKKSKKKSKSMKAKKTAGGKVKLAKKQASKGKTPRKSAKKKAAPKKVVAKKAVAKKKGPGKKASSVKTVASKQPHKKGPGRAGSAFSRNLPESRSGEQAGDLQGLSNIESVDSESVDELVEEGNAFEAGVVAGVEEADENDESEVHTREVPEDDVPGEYLDEE
jgi:hypothetical protein